MRTGRFENVVYQYQSQRVRHGVHQYFREQELYRHRNEKDKQESENAPHFSRAQFSSATENQYKARYEIKRYVYIQYGIYHSAAIDIVLVDKKNPIVHKGRKAK